MVSDMAVCHTQSYTFPLTYSEKKTDFKLHNGFRPTFHVIRAIPRHLSRSYLPVLYGSMNDIKIHNRQQKAVCAWHCDDANHDSPLACLSLPIRPHFG